MRTRRSSFPLRLSLAAAALGVAALATACLPPAAPAPDPTTSTTTTSTTTTSTTTTTTTTTTSTTLPPSCPVASDAPLEGTAAQGSGTEYTAVVRRGGRTHVMVREAHSAADVAKFRADAAASGEVVAFSADQEVHALDQTEAWGFTDDGFRGTWTTDPATQGTGVRVAVLDTGIDATLSDFQGRLDPLPGVDMLTQCSDASHALVPTPGVTTDPNGHGTHVSGIIAADDDTNGVVGAAPGVTLVPVRVLDSGGSGKFSNVAAGILWAADKTKGNASVISMSLGGSYDGGVVGAAIAAVEDPTNDTYTHPVIVVAAGNGSGGATEYPAAYGSANSYGTAFPQVLPVAALCKPGFFLAPRSGAECATVGTIASFSSKPWNGVAAATGVSAPGTSIVSDYPLSLSATGTKVLSGTSMATPLVAALAALTSAHCPAYTAADVVGRIESASTDLGASGPDTTYGFGAINPAATLAPC